MLQRAVRLGARAGGYGPRQHSAPFDSGDAASLARCQPGGGLAATCDETPEEDWIRFTFEGRCHFYPGRDCPGWREGGTCSRIGRRIAVSDDEDSRPEAP